MIVNDGPKVVSNISDTQEFTITNDSARLFRMLSDFLYSNKEMCVLHEISANALDAHKLVGKELDPIHVYAPTQFNPALRIRDFGPGLSEEDVRKLLTTYGESGSHKRTSNDYFGSWGIGSKSPASVTKTWDITSHFEGSATLYKIFINERGVPVLTKLTEAQTDTTGLEVSIPIDPTKHKVWINLFPTVYEHYSVKPKFFGCQPIFNQYEVLHEGSGWNIIKQPPTYVDSCGVVISNRVYKINPTELAQFFKTKIEGTLLPVYNELLSNQSLYLYFNTGELELSVSRESIQYTKHTIVAFEKKLGVVVAELRKEFLSSVNVNTSQLSYKLALVRYLQKFTNNRLLRLGELFLEEVGNPYAIHCAYDINDFIISDIEVLGVTTKQMKVTSKPNYRSYGFVNFDSSQGDKFDVKLSLPCIVAETFKIVVRDAFDTNVRIKAPQSNIGNCIIIDSSQVDKVPKELKKLVIKASSLPKVVREKKHKEDKGVDNSRNWYWLTCQGGVYKFTSISNEEVIKPAPNLVYITFTHARRSDTVEYHNEIDRLLAYGAIRVIGVRNGAEPPNGVIHATEYSKSIEMFMAKNADDYATFNWFRNNRFHGYISYTNELSADSYMRKEVEKYNKIQCDAAKISMFGIYTQAELSRASKSISNYKCIFDIYPMLKYNYRNDMAKEDFVQYVKLIDKEIEDGKV